MGFIAGGVSSASESLSEIAELEYPAADARQVEIEVGIWLREGIGQTHALADQTLIAVDREQDVCRPVTIRDNDRPVRRCLLGSVDIPVELLAG
jgi:hypothetical protein